MMRLIARALFLAISVLVSAGAQARDLMQQDLIQLQRQDQQTFPAKWFAPNTAQCAGVAIISHGAGGSENGYSYLAKAMSELGYLSVVVGHQQSGRTALREKVSGRGLRSGLGALVTDADAYRGRLMDIDAARRWALDQCPGKEALLIGHSMGAATVMIEAGAKNNLGLQGGDHFAAYIALSPQGVGTIFPENAWVELKKPVLSMTGTRDTELGGASWETRTEAFQNMRGKCQWLGVVDKATHMHFAGNGLGSQATEKLTVFTITQFLQAQKNPPCRAPEAVKGLQLSAK